MTQPFLRYKSTYVLDDNPIGYVCNFSLRLKRTGKIETHTWLAGGRVRTNKLAKILKWRNICDRNVKNSKQQQMH